MCTEHHYWHHDYVRLAWDSGFCFDNHKSKTNLDWSSIGVLDVEKIVRDRDIAIVEKHLSTVINYYLEPDHVKILDPTFVKIFRLSQLSVQYLQFCKRYLDNTVVLIKKELAKCREENTTLKDYAEELKSEITDLKKSIKTLKDSLQNQAFSFENANAFKCPTCLKMFLTEEYLTAHVKRRHENMSPLQSETDKLQLEIKELKERLNTTEKFIQSDPLLKIQGNVDSNKVIEEEKETRVDVLIYKFDELKQFVERELTTLKNEKCNDRYERWLEIVFKRLDNSKREWQNEKYDGVDILSTGDGYCENKKIDNVTQTVRVICKDSEVMTEVLDDDEITSKSPVLDVDIKKLQDDIYTNTENQLGQIQDALQQKLTGGLEQIQTQISTFCEKINTMETERALLIDKIQHVSPLKAQISPALVTAKSSKNGKKINEEKIQPKPAPRVTKSVPLVRKKTAVTTRRSAPKLETKPFAKVPLGGLNSNICSCSSMSEDEKVLFPPINSQHELINKSTMTIDDEQQNIELKTLYNKNVSVTTKYESSSKSDEDSFVEAPIRPSTSTLGRRSISSLKQAGKDKVVLGGLRNELEEMLSLRLKAVGVSPTWKRLPEKSYLKAMGIIQHQAELTTKKYPNYNKIKDRLIKKINAALKKSTKSIIGSKTTPIEKKHVTRVPVRRSKPPQEKKITYSLDDEDSSNKSFVMTPKQVQSVGIETVENKPSNTSNTTKKKVLFDLEESSSISKLPVEKIQDIRSEKSVKEDGNPTLTMVTSRAKAEKVLIDKIDLLGSTTQIKGKDSEGTTESITSSILDGTKMQSSHKKDNTDNVVAKEETSDWEISDIY